MKFFGKRFFAIALLLCLSFSLFACSFKKQPVQQGYPQVTTEKEKTPEELIVGTWIIESKHGIIDGREEAEYFGPEDSYPMVFLADGSMWGEEGFTHWQIQGNSLVSIPYDYEGEETDRVVATIIKLDQDYLVLRFDSSNSSDASYGEYADITLRRLN